MRSVLAIPLTVVLVASSLLANTTQRAQAQPQALSGTLTVFDYQSLSNPQGQALISSYEHLHPGVHIKISPMPAGDPLPIIDAQLAGGTAADIMTLATDEQPWKDLPKGWWADLTSYANAPDPYVPGNKHWIDLLTPGAAKEIKFANGHIYALTTTGFDVAFFYNKDIFAKLHLSVPRTWAQLVGEYKKIKAAGYIPLDYELGDHEYAGQDPAFVTILEDTLMHSSIARMDTNHDGVVDVHEMVQGIKKGLYSTHNADYQESWKLVKSLAPYFQLGAAATVNSSSGFNLFKTGRVATWFEGSFNDSALAKTNIKWGAFTMPLITPDVSRFATAGPQRTGGFGACCGYPWAIPASTQKRGHMALALDFLYYLSAPKNTDTFAAGSGVLSVERDAAPQPKLAAFIDAANHVSRVGVAELSMPPAFIQTRSRLLEEYVTGSLSLSQAMSQMQTEMNTDAASAAKLYGFK